MTTDTDETGEVLEVEAEDTPQAPRDEAPLQEELSRSQAALKAAAQAYRALVLKLNPEIPEELIKGESVEEIERQVASAQEMVRRIKEALPRRIPTGAPERAEADLSGLSPAEKIKYGIQKEVGKWR